MKIVSQKEITAKDINDAYDSAKDEWKKAIDEFEKARLEYNKSYTELSKQGEQVKFEFLKAFNDLVYKNKIKTSEKRKPDKGTNLIEYFLTNEKGKKTEAKFSIHARALLTGTDNEVSLILRNINLEDRSFSFKGDETPEDLIKIVLAHQEFLEEGDVVLK